MNDHFSTDSVAAEECYRRLALQIGQAGLAAGETLSLKVVSQSMAPLLLPGDWVVIEAVRPGDLRSGDVIVIQVGQDFFTHRLICVRGDGLQTKGDRNSQADAYLTTDAAQVFGRVIARRRGATQMDLRQGPWMIVNPLLAWLGRSEAHWRAHRWVARIFRAVAYLITKAFMINFG